MDSTCPLDKIQITQDLAHILESTNLYKITPRGTIQVKGKGSMTTLYLDS